MNSVTVSVPSNFEIIFDSVLHDIEHTYEEEGENFYITVHKNDEAFVEQRFNQTFTSREGFQTPFLRKCQGDAYASEMRGITGTAGHLFSLRTVLPPFMWCSHWYHS